MGSRNHQNMGVLLLLYFHYLSLLGIDGMSRTWILISDGLYSGGPPPDAKLQGSARKRG
jgi:hypothetical protein